MNKSTTRILYLVGLIIGLAAIPLIIFGLLGSKINPATHMIEQIANPTLYISGVITAIVGSLLIAIAWVGALIKTAQLRQWIWFVFLLCLSGITLLVYSFAGPETPAPPERG